MVAGDPDGCSLHCFSQCLHLHAPVLATDTLLAAGFSLHGHALQDHPVLEVLGVQIVHLNAIPLLRHGPSAVETETPL